MNRAVKTDEVRIQRIYSQLTFLALLLHLVHAVIFFRLSFTFPAVYNCISVVFYMLVFYMARHQMYRTAVCSIHIESCLFVLCCVISTGWDTGIALYMLALSSLVYFCPFDHKFVPYAFSVTELAVFLSLRVFTYYHEPVYSNLTHFTAMAYYTFNAFACFGIILFAAFFSNISAMVTNIRLRSENRSLSAIANSDFLTGLPSRRAFLQKVKSLPSDSSVVATIGDLDDFKGINDNFGHSFGDYVLRTVGSLINSNCKEQILPCRWGGEEFVILFYNCSSSYAIDWLQKLRCQIAAHPFEYEEQKTDITVTMGVYSGNIAEGIEHIITKADKCLYAGKEMGKNCVVISQETPQHT